MFSLQHMGDFNYPRLADFGAAISGANKLLCQEVLEELDVRALLEAPFSSVNVFYISRCFITCPYTKLPKVTPSSFCGSILKCG
jgi:hypothetical protein